MPPILLAVFLTLNYAEKQEDVQGVLAVSFDKALITRDKLVP